VMATSNVRAMDAILRKTTTNIRDIQNKNFRTYFQMLQLNNLHDIAPIILMATNNNPIRFVTIPTPTISISTNARRPRRTATISLMPHQAKAPD
jgi:hypothetical protein